MKRWAGGVATLSDGGLLDGGESESPVDPTPRTKGGSPHRITEFGNEIAYTDLLQVAKMRGYMYVCGCVRACMCEEASSG